MAQKESPFIELTHPREKWEELRNLLAVKHEHPAGMNECSVCDEPLLNAAIKEIHRLRETAKVFSAVATEATHHLRRLKKLSELLKDVADAVGENPPFEDFFKRYYQLTGEHMVLTEEGWVPAKMNTREYLGGGEPAEVLDEVNRPDDPPAVQPPAGDLPY